MIGVLEALHRFFSTASWAKNCNYFHFTGRCELRQINLTRVTAKSGGTEVTPWTLECELQASTLCPPQTSTSQLHRLPSIRRKERKVNWEYQLRPHDLKRWALNGLLFLMFIFARARESHHASLGSRWLCAAQRTGVQGSVEQVLQGPPSQLKPPAAALKAAQNQWVGQELLLLPWCPCARPFDKPVFL